MGNPLVRSHPGGRAPRAALRAPRAALRAPLAGLLGAIAIFAVLMLATTPSVRPPPEPAPEHNYDPAVIGPLTAP